MIQVYIGNENVYRIRLYPNPTIYQFANAIQYREIVIYDDGNLQHRENHWWHFINIIGWIRLTIRRDVLNRLIVFIEEIQSDWFIDNPNHDAVRQWLDDSIQRLITFVQNNGINVIGWVTWDMLVERFGIIADMPSVRHLYDRDIGNKLSEFGTITTTDINIKRNGTNIKTIPCVLF